MILVDTSVWIDHLRTGNAGLTALLESCRVLIHPFIIGELACGNLKNRSKILRLLHTLPPCRQAAHDEVLALLEMNNLYRKGIGWIDAHLLGSAKITGAELWTYDRTLAEVYENLKFHLS